jgi:hypothetical protein
VPACAGVRWWLQEGLAWAERCGQASTQAALSRVSPRLMRLRRLRAAVRFLSQASVPDCAEVADFEAPPAAGGDLGDDPPHVGPVLPVVLTWSWAGGPVAAGGPKGDGAAGGDVPGGSRPGRSRSWRSHRREVQWRSLGWKRSVQISYLRGGKGLDLSIAIAETVTLGKRCITGITFSYESPRTSEYCARISRMLSCAKALTVNQAIGFPSE